MLYFGYVESSIILSVQASIWPNKAHGKCAHTHTRAHTHKYTHVYIQAKALDYCSSATTPEYIHTDAHTNTHSYTYRQRHWTTEAQPSHQAEQTGKAPAPAPAAAVVEELLRVV